MKEQGEELDLELPDDFPIERLMPMLGKVAELPGPELEAWVVKGRLAGEPWRQIDADFPLIDVGLWDGAFLRLCLKDTTNASSLPTQVLLKSKLPFGDWKPLFPELDRSPIQS
jgi:hypothetical protein